MEVNINVVWMDELESAVQNAEKCMAELRSAVGKIHEALRNLGMEANQPMARTTD